MGRSRRKAFLRQREFPQSSRRQDRPASPARSGGPLAPGDTLRVQLDGQGAQLGNKGGIITLLDQHGLKIDGVSWTREMVRKQGWTLVV